MRRVYSKKLAIILILTFMATMFVSVPMASASATYSVTSVSKVTAGKSQELGSIKVLFHMAELDKTSYLTMRLPSDFKFNPENGHNLQGAMKLEPVDNVNDVFRLVYNGVSADGVEIRIPAVKNALAVAQEVYGINKHAYESFTIQHLADNEIKITIDPGKINRNTSEKQGYFFVDFKNVYVDSGYSGDIDVVIDGQQGTLFSSGKLIVGSAGTGTVELSVDSVKTLTTGIGMIDNIRLKEDRPGAFAKGETIKLRLPEGFKWDKDSVALDIFDGDNILAEFTLQDDGKVLVMESKENSKFASYLIIRYLRVVVDEPTKAPMGEVKLAVRGTASCIPGELVVARCLGPELDVIDTEPAAGAHEVPLNQVVKLTLGGEVYPGKYFDSIALQIVGAGVTEIDGDGSMDTYDVVISADGSSGGTGGGGGGGGGGPAPVWRNVPVQCSIFNNVLTIQPREQLEPGTTYRVYIPTGALDSVGASRWPYRTYSFHFTTEGVTWSPIIRETNPVQNGLQIPIDQVITINFNKRIVSGSAFDQISLKDNAGKIVSVELKCSDRTLTIKPQDNLKKGTRYSVTIPPGAVRSPVGDPFTGTYTLTFTTTADGPHSVDFKVGQNMVIVDGQERLIDVSPVYRDNHVFASIRPVAEALDLDPRWDDAASTIVFVRRNTVVEWPMGYTAILVNGQAVETGVSPIMESDRVFIPIKYVAEAFGYEVSEDPGGVRLWLGEAPQDDPGKPEEPAKTSSGGGGGGSPAPTGPLLEESIRIGASTIAQISGKVKVEIPDKAIEGKDSKLVIGSVSESKMARAGLSALSPALEIAVENGQIVGKIAVTMNFNRNQLKSEEKAAIFYYDEKAREWMQLEGTLNDTRDAITVEVDHPVMLAVFAVVEETDTVKSEAPVPAPVSTQLKDLQGHWAVSDVMQLAQMGAVCGYPDETFKPDKNITRAEVMAILTSALDYEDSSDVSILHATFADVDDIPAWAGEAVAVGVKQGMISGYPQADGTMIFGANRPISRIELVTIIGRILADEMGSDDLTQSEFKDNSDIPVWGRNAVNSVVVKGVIKGYPDNTFRARNQVTRAEAAAMIMRLMEHK